MYWRVREITPFITLVATTVGCIVLMDEEKWRKRIGSGTSGTIIKVEAHR
jgi:hypothetical protein